MSEINKFSRFSEPPKEGAFCDLLWADPCENDEEAVSTEWLDNGTRGCSYVFGAKAATPFLNKNDFLSIIRAHEAQLDGFKMYKWNNTVDFPSVITIFSAPNYCDVYNNKGAVIKFKNNMVNIQQFNYSPHPFILPQFMNIFNWSIPFVSEKSKI
jgi:serine/threonine-protein phosphatase 2B catalytic subunit